MSKNGCKISLDCPFKDLYYYLARHSSVRALIRIRIRIRIRLFPMRIRNTAGMSPLPSWDILANVIFGINMKSVSGKSGNVMES
jgi:hypothetical protein